MNWSKISFITLILLFCVNLVFAEWVQSEFVLSGIGLGVNTQPDMAYYNDQDDAGFNCLINWDKATLTQANNFINDVASSDLTNSIVVYHWQSTEYGATDRITHNSIVSGNAIVQGQVASQLDNLYDSSILGWLVWDEPLDNDDFNDIEVMTSLIQNHSTSGITNTLPYTSLFPIYSTQVESNYTGSTYVDKYKKYIDNYLSRINENIVLSSDIYPIKTIGGSHVFRDDYYLNLEILRDKANQYSTSNYQIPVWVIIQLSNQVPAGYPVPAATVKEVSLQMYSSLAYGAKGILYYTSLDCMYHQDGIYLNSTSTDVNSMRNGSRWTAVAAINNEVKCLGDTLMQLIPLATYHNDSQPDDQAELTLFGETNQAFNIVKDIDGGSAMMGYFRHKDTGKHYAMIVNKSLTSTTTFNVYYNKALRYGTNTPRVYKINKTNPGSYTEINSNSFHSDGNRYYFTISIEAAKGELLRIEPAAGSNNVIEFINNINDIENDVNVSVSDDRLYIAHDNGVFLKYEKGTGGYFFKYFDNWGETKPVVDIELDEIDSSNKRVYICHDNGTTGNMVTMDWDLKDCLNVFNDGGANTRVTSVAFSNYTYTDNSTPPRTTVPSIYIGQRSASSGNVVVINRSSFSYIDTWASGYKVNDVEYQGNGHKSIAIAHDAGIIRVSTGSYWFALGDPSATEYSTSVPVKEIEADVDAVYAVLNDGTLAIRSPGLGTAILTTCFNETCDISLVDETRFTISTNSSSGNAQYKSYDTNNYSTYDQNEYANAVARTALDTGNKLYAATTEALYVETINLTKPINDNQYNVKTVYSFKLNENYPNPFNPTTNIAFEIPETGNVELKVYNIQGREIASLVNGDLEAGEHNAIWNATDNYGKTVASGVYFYKLKCKDHVAIKKMVLVK